jgi:hypothetical protein
MNLLAVSLFSVYGILLKFFKDNTIKPKKDGIPHLQMVGSEFPRSEDGCTYHLQSKDGQGKLIWY